MLRRRAVVAEARAKSKHPQEMCPRSDHPSIRH
jgi:hypothetical protein